MDAVIYVFEYRAKAPRQHERAPPLDFFVLDGIGSSI